jgi:AraC-like ligand binding domain
MQTFKAKRVDEVGEPPGPWRERRAHGLRAPGPIVMVVREGTCWVRRDDGSRVDLDAQSVVVWEPGEWVEYGSDGGGFEVERYWAEDLSEDEWKAIFAEVFGPEAVE